tara:strand:+ start:671 stop:1183 length:513 start_codon:yes stop_codon:yes gene_type:complete
VIDLDEVAFAPEAELTQDETGNTNNIFVKPGFIFKKGLTHVSPSSPISKSLYEREGSINNFGQEVIMNIAALDNVLFWHRNLKKGKGFASIGSGSNHYRDFIIYTMKGHLILIETKGDYLDTVESQAKNTLGKRWAKKAGENYKYFMVFQSKEVPGTYTAKTIVDIMKML